MNKSIKHLLVIQHLPFFRIQMLEEFEELGLSAEVVINGSDAIAASRKCPPSHIVVNPESISADVFQSLRGYCPAADIVLSVRADLSGDVCKEQVAAYGAIGAAGRGIQSILAAFDAKTTAPTFSPREQRLQREALQKKQEKAQSQLPLAQLVQEDRFELLLIERFANKAELTETELRLANLLEFGLRVGASGFSVTLSDIEIDLKAVHEMFQRLSWNRDAEALEKYVERAGGWEAVEEDGEEAEMTVLDDSSGIFEALESKIRFDELESQSHALREFILENITEFNTEEMGDGAVLGVEHVGKEQTSFLKWMPVVVLIVFVLWAIAAGC